jgi:4-phytase/acid phosphatase
MKLVEPGNIQMKAIAMNPITPNIEPQPSTRCRKAVAGGFLNRIHAVGQASRRSLTLNFRFGMRVWHASPHPFQSESIFLIWRQARRLFYAGSRSDGGSLAEWFRLKVVLAVLLLAMATPGPVLAQTTNTADDGTVLKQIIIFGRHSIRSATSDTNSLNGCSANPSPGFTGVPVGYLTPNGRKAASLMGSYFHDYLVHEGVLTGDSNTDLARSYFRANVIERSYVTAAKFGAKLIPGASIPVHTYYPTNPYVADLVFDPLLAGVATVDPARALAEIQGVYGSGTNLSAAYSSELSLVSQVLYPPGTQPLYPGTSPTNNAPPGSFDPTTLPILLTTNAPQYSTNSTNYYFTGEVIGMGGLSSTISTADPFVMQYADNFPTNEVAWGRLTLDELSQQTRLVTLQFDICLRQPYLARVQSSSAASHILRSMLQVTGGVQLDGALGTPQSQVLVIISSDGYVAGLAGLLDMHWLLPGYQPDFCPPGGALVFELRQVTATGQYLVRVFYTAQTFDQLRNRTTLTLAVPPATQQLLVPGGSSTTNLDVDFTTFTNLMNAAIGMEYVEPFAKEIQPIVQNPYITYNPTNITASVSSNTLTIAWPADHVGWMLQAQTNGLSAGQWFDWPGSDVVNAVVTTLDPANPSVFYRLREE